jgi:glucose-1-phosphate thymidylyltransferase
MQHEAFPASNGMKAIITAGHGRPTKPLGHVPNKHLLELANKPLILHALEKAAETGINDVGIVVEDGTEHIRKTVGDGTQFGLNITYIPQKGGALGLAHAINCAQNFLGEDKFMVYLGDNIVTESILEMRKRFEREGANCMLALAKIQRPERFGVPEFDSQGRIIKVEERPIRPKSPYAVAGIYFYDKNVHLAFPHLKPSFRGVYEISDLHTWLAKNGYDVRHYEIQNWWKDRGQPQDLLEGNVLALSNIQNKTEHARIDAAAALQGVVRIGEKTKIGGRTVIRGPVVIGDHCLIKDSYIGPYTSIGDEVELHNAHIDHSIIYSGAAINTSKKITDSIIGQDAVISENTHETPAGSRLVVSENSIISL